MSEQTNDYRIAVPTDTMDVGDMVTISDETHPLHYKGRALFVIKLGDSDIEVCGKKGSDAPFLIAKSRVCHIMKKIS